METLRAEMEQFKALLQAPPTPSAPQGVAWDSDDNDTISIRALNLPFEVGEGAVSPRKDPNPELSNFQRADL